MERSEAILIAGPTASGKSALALRLAQERGGVVVNADSMQVYADLRILSARPTPADEAGVPHRLYGHVDGGVNFSVGRYVEDTARLLAELPSSVMPIFCGGTGLYFKALTEGLSNLPPVAADIRAQVRDAAEGRATADLHADLAHVDPEGAARLRPSDRQRILRALEIHVATGRPIASFQGERIPGPLADRAWRGFFVMPDRAKLRACIDARFETMMAEGALDEVRRLAGRGLDPALPIMRAHGVPVLLAHLRGEMSLAEAVAKGQADTRAYAKRQVTWFRHQMAGWQEIAAAADPTGLGA